MTFGRLLLRSLLYHWRGNLAVLMGVVVGTAVLTGALLVGDSQRGSLKELALRRLGWVDNALVSDHFLRESLADELNAKRVAPIILARGAAENLAGDRENSPATILGVDARFWPTGHVPQGEQFWRQDDEDGRNRAVVLNAALAKELKVEVGGRVRVSLQQASAVPREVLLGQRDNIHVEFEATVAEVLPDEHPLASFGLEPSQARPRNLFLPLPQLQAQVTPRPKRGETDPLPKDRVNVFLVEGGEAEQLQAEFYQKVKPGDVDLRLRMNAAPRYLSVESRRTILSPSVAEAAVQTTREMNRPAAPTLVYLANSIAGTGGEIPYSVIAALDPQLAAPLGPFLPPGEKPLAEDEILLVAWPESPLKVKPGDDITLKYFDPEAKGKPVEREETFTLRGFVPLEGVGADRGLTPAFPGITDRDSPRDWETPSSFDREDIDARMRPRDNEWWRKYRATPKAYISLKRGEQLWGSRFGNRTSIRIDLGDATAEDFATRLMAKLTPQKLGLIFRPVKADALRAAGGGTDFAMLFLGFSFFLILSALLLVGLLFRLSLDRRSQEVGVLLASGLRLATIRRLMLVEGVILALVGGLVGSGVAVLYGDFLIGELRKRWPGGLDASTLQLHVTPMSLLIGYGAALAVSILTIYWAVRVLGHIAPRALIQGQTTDEVSPLRPQKPRWSRWVAIVALVAGIGCLAAAPFISGHEAKAGTFFGGGMLLLTAGLAGLSLWMRGSRHTTVSGQGTSAVARLGVRNAARHPSRSLLTAGLLAAAAFLLVGVESFRREPGKDYLRKDGGSGGYALLAESDQSLYLDLNNDAGRAEVLSRLRLRWQDEKVKDIPTREKEAEALLKEIAVVAFRVRSGDDASCLNLYQPGRPRLMGVPESFIADGGFAFASTVEKRDNPWTLLNDDTEAVPVVGENNTVVWMLRSGLGKSVTVPDEQGSDRELKIVGLLHDSVFQSGLLMSEQRFQRLYPNETGHRFFLIRVEPEKADAVRKLLQSALWASGFVVTPTRERLMAYLEVENMYLSTFQLLGGMGLLLGTLGLAVVLLRSVWERRGELALLRALGYRNGMLGWLVLAENGFLLLLGLGLGTLAALVSVTPHLLTGGGQVQWLSLLGMLGLSLLAGLVASVAATTATLRAALLPALRRE